MKKTIVLLGMLACVSLTACTNSNDSNSDTKSATDISTTQTEKETEPTETIYNIGDTVSLKNWSIVTTDAKTVDKIYLDYGSFSPDSGNMYAQVFVTITNNGKEADQFLPSFSTGDKVSAKLLYGDGYEFSATNLLGYDAEMHDSTINPLSSLSGEIAFEIPESVASSAEELLLQFKAGNDVVKIKIR